MTSSCLLRVNSKWVEYIWVQIMYVSLSILKDLPSNKLCASCVSFLVHATSNKSNVPMQNGCGEIVHHTTIQFNGPSYRLQPPPVGLKRPEVTYNVCGSWWSSHKKINIRKQRLRHICHHTHSHPKTHSLLQKRNHNFWEMWTHLSPQNTIAGILLKAKGHWKTLISHLEINCFPFHHPGRPWRMEMCWW